MHNFILLYRGPTTPPDASHQGWPEWFARTGDRLVDVGSPMLGGFAVHADSVLTDTAADLNGFSVVRAENRDEVRELVRDHPFLAHGSDYTIEVFEAPRAG